MLDSWKGVKIGDTFIYIGESQGSCMTGFDHGDCIQIAGNNHTGFRVKNLTNLNVGHGYLYDAHNAAHIGYDDNAAASMHLLKKDLF
jgi:hypothetical protein